MRVGGTYGVWSYGYGGVTSQAWQGRNGRGSFPKPIGKYCAAKGSGNSCGQLPCVALKPKWNLKVCVDAAKAHAGYYEWAAQQQEDEEE